MHVITYETTYVIMHVIMYETTFVIKHIYKSIYT